MQRNLQVIVETSTGHTLESDILAASKEEACTRHYVYNRPSDAKSLYYNMNWTQINFADSSCIAFIIRDETALVELGKKKEEENYSKRLVASITHDLRTPLNGIMGIADALEEFVYPSGKHFLGLVKNTGMLMLYLINDVLDMVQIEAKKLRLRKAMYSPKEIIEETIQLMKFNFTQKAVNLVLSFAHNIPKEIFSDKARYRQILLNLLGNALKFTSKGVVSVAVFYDPKTDMLITKVTDTGPGIAPEDFPKLFQLFSCFSNTESINPSGVGLGLHICKSLSKQLGGDIFAESQFRYGAAFTFYIACGLVIENTEAPVPDQEYFKAITLSIATTLSEETKDDSPLLDQPKEILRRISHTLSLPKGDTCDCPKILLVDDNQMNLFVLGSYLKGTGIKANIAYNGKEAIESIIQKTKSSCCKGYKVVYMDINMPVMDGVEATTILNDKMQLGEIPFVPIIALSAGGGNEYRGEDTFKEVLDKPISRDKFLSSVAQHCPI